MLRKSSQAMKLQNSNGHGTNRTISEPGHSLHSYKQSHPRAPLAATLDQEHAPRDAREDGQDAGLASLGGPPFLKILDDLAGDASSLKASENKPNTLAR